MHSAKIGLCLFNNETIMRKFIVNVLNMNKITEYLSLI